MTKVVHITTVHPSADIRIFNKECKTLARASYEVTLIAQHIDNEIVDGVNILALPKPRNRLNRILGLTWQAFRLALTEQADIYHFHDPELLMVGLLLKLFSNGKVIYDVHEDVPQQILTKYWIPLHLRTPIAMIFNVVEKTAVQYLDCVVVATESIAEKFTRYNPIVIHNYPKMKMMATLQAQPTQEEKENILVYIGVISEIRGVFEMVHAFDCWDSNMNAHLDLIGKFETNNLKETLKMLPGYEHVRFLGWLSWHDAWQRAQKGIGGLVLFHPAPNHVRSLPNKLFEYMAASLPIIASNFPSWKEIVEGNHCGLTVDPLNPKDISEAIKYLIQHPGEARLMGERGRKAVVERYNWEKEGEKLLSLYGELLKR